MSPNNYFTFYDKQCVSNNYFTFTIVYHNCKNIKRCNTINF